MNTIPNSTFLRVVKEHDDAYWASTVSPLEMSRFTFKRWLGAEYDMDIHDAVVAAAAAEKLDGDPLWLLVISGSGNAKTETVQSLAGAGATITSTVSSEAALLSGSPQREKTKDATGGLLLKIGPDGVLVIKDMTSILSMNRESRAGVLAALREVHDGRWERNVGANGGRTLTWTGRLGIVGAVTTAWDQAHSVIAAMGDRFVLVRADSTRGRMAAGRRSIQNVGNEAAMRAELADAVGLIIERMSKAPAILTQPEQERILSAADVVTLARTAVEFDYQGNIIDAHAPEMPTRFAKQLAQMFRGAVAIGMERDAALRLALRCAQDSMPPLRLELLWDIEANPASRPSECARRLGKPWKTVDRQLQCLQMLGLLICDEQEGFAGKSSWHYSLAGGIDLDVLETAKP